MSTFYGDFLGFQLGDVHSERINIVRVSSGNRYSDNLIPAFKDTTSEIPGSDGQYYWKTDFTTRTFQIVFAYDDLREEDLRKLSAMFGYKGLQPLIFDEFPYKKYMVKCSGQPDLKYICFDDGPLRHFKGEGTINLVAYFPFGISTARTSIQTDHSANLFNAGDLETDIEIFYDISDYPFWSDIEDGRTIEITDKQNNILLKLEEIKNLGTSSNKDYYLIINSKTHLVEGLDKNFNKTGRLYNRFITQGSFFKLPVGYLHINSSPNFYKIEYNLLYY